MKLLLGLLLAHEALGCCPWYKAMWGMKCCDGTCMVTFGSCTPPRSAFEASEAAVRRELKKLGGMSADYPMEDMDYSLEAPSYGGMGGMSYEGAPSRGYGKGETLHGFTFYQAPSSVGGMSSGGMANPCLMKNTCDFCTDHEGFLGKCTSSGYCEARHEYQDVACGGMGPQGPWTGTAFEGIGGMSQDAVGGMRNRPRRPRPSSRRHDPSENPCSVTIYDRFHFQGRSRTFTRSQDDVSFRDPTISLIVKGDGCMAELFEPGCCGWYMSFEEGPQHQITVGNTDTWTASKDGAISIKIQRDGGRLPQFGGMSSGIGGMSSGYGGEVYCGSQLTKQECQYHGCSASTGCPCMWQDNYDHYEMDKGTGYCMKSKYTFSG